MASGVPNLRLYNLIVDVDAASGEFNADGGFGFQTEFVFGESWQEIGFADARISDQNHLEQVVVVVVRSIRAHISLPAMMMMMDLKEWIEIQFNDMGGFQPSALDREREALLLLLFKETERMRKVERREKHSKLEWKRYPFRFCLQMWNGEKEKHKQSL